MSRDAKPLPHSTITTLCSRVDKLEAELSSYSSLRMRQSSRPMKHVESERTPQYQRKSSAAAVDMKRLSTDSISSVTSVNHTLSDTPFPWHMPFTVKCVGTFRYAWGTCGSTKGLTDCGYVIVGRGVAILWLEGRGGS